VGLTSIFKAGSAIQKAAFLFHWFRTILFRKERDKKVYSVPAAHRILAALLPDPFRANSAEVIPFHVMLFLVAL